MLAIVIAMLVVAGGAVWVARDRQWAQAKPWIVRVDDWWAHAEAYVSLAPATFVYLFVLLVTGWVIRTSDPIVARTVLANHSTNLHNLHVDPVGVLITSAFWNDSRSLSWVVLFALVMAPTERWLGTVRTIIAFATGHVIATLTVALVLEYKLVTLAGHDASRHSIDVGVSYGFFCIAAIFTYRLSGRGIWAWLWAAGVTLVVAVPYALDRSFTEFGHVTAVAIGFLLYPLTRGAMVRLRREWPIWKTPAASVAAARTSMQFRQDARHPRLHPAEPHPSETDAPT